MTLNFSAPRTYEMGVLVIPPVAFFFSTPNWLLRMLRGSQCLEQESKRCYLGLSQSWISQVVLEILAGATRGTFFMIYPCGCCGSDPLVCHNLLVRGCYRLLGHPFFQPKLSFDMPAASLEPVRTKERQ